MAKSLNFVDQFRSLMNFQGCSVPRSVIFMHLLIVLVLRLLITSFAAASYYRDFSYSALHLVNACRSSDTLSHNEDLVHERALKLRSSGMDGAARHVLMIVEKEYVGYLQRVREKTLGEENLRRVVESITNMNAWAYRTPSKSNEVIRRIRKMSIVPGENYDNDLIAQEYFKSSKTALESFFLTMYDYQMFTEIPTYESDYSIRTGQEALKEFITKYEVIAEGYNFQ